MKNKIIILLIILNFGFNACNNSVKSKKEDANSEELNESLIEKINAPNTFDGILKSLPLKRTPIIDITNFDNIKEVKEFNPEEIKLLQLSEIYLNIEKEGYSYKFLPSYRLELSDDFYTIIITVFKGDHELETILINYNLDEKLTAHNIIAYDEIAEGWSRKHSKIEKSSITIIDEFYGDEVQIDTSKFHINTIGEINQIKTTFTSKIRPDKAIKLNTTYTDTIAFSTYNNDYDYLMLLGKKNGDDVRLIYNWDWHNNYKYNFKYGDLLKVEWKMDSIYIAGDGEAIDFAEKAIEAVRIESKNKSVKFLWRAEKFDEEINQKINSIFINESFVNSITNQEKAALGFVATFIGNECSWDGDVNENRSNLKCKILTVLNLGYQCSDTHFGFLKRWFSKDEIALKKLEKCVTMPETATVQTTFDEIVIDTDTANKTISVSYKIQGINMRESKTWNYTQTDYFKYDLKNITWVDSKKSKVANND
jgi:hypothetical protein